MPIAINSRKIVLPTGASKYGNVSVQFSFKLQAGEIFDCDLSSLIDRIESVYFDCTQTSTSFQVDFLDTGRSLILPPGSESSNRTFSNQPSFRITNLDASNPVIAQGFAFTCNQPVFERFPGSGLLRAGGVAQPPGQLSQTTTYANPGPYVGALGGIFDPTVLPLFAGRTPPAAITNANKSVFVGAQSGGGWPGAKAVSGGKFYWEMQSGATGSDLGGVEIGVCNAAWNSGPLSNLGPASSRIMYQLSTGQVNLISGSNVTIDAFSTSVGYVGFALDATAGLLWIRPLAAGNWNGNVANNPSTGVGGYPAPAAPIFFAHMQNSGYFDNVLTVVSAKPFGSAVPTGFNPGWPQ